MFDFMENNCTMSKVLNNPDGNFKKIFEEIVSELTPPCEKKDDIPVPKQCVDCPRVAYMLGYLGSLGESAACLMEADMGDKVTISTNEETIYGDEATRRLRQIAAETLNKLDEETNTIGEEIVRSTNGCKGPLVLEESDGRRTVRVTACDSPEMLDSAGLGEEQIGEPVVIKREKKNKD